MMPDFDNPDKWLCRCEDLKTGDAIYCYKHKLKGGKKHGKRNT